MKEKDEDDDSRLSINQNNDSNIEDNNQSIDFLINNFKIILNKGNQSILKSISNNIQFFDLILRTNKSLYNKKEILFLLFVSVKKLNKSLTEYNIFRDLLIQKTLIIYEILLIYMTNNDSTIKDISFKLLKNLLISHVEMIKIFQNLFPKTIFEKIQIDPIPFNWINEWDDFLKIILENFNEAKLVWNEDCRQELIQYLTKIFQKYDKYIIQIDKKDIISQNGNNIFKLQEKLINSNFDINYKSIIMKYNSLEKEVFVMKYYLQNIIKENQGMPYFNIEFENPNKLWKNLIMELGLEKSPQKIIIILKVLILLYKNYYQNKKKGRKDFKCLGKFKDYDFFLSYFQSNDNIEIRTYLIHLLYVSITCQDQKVENRKELLNHENIGIIIKTYIKSIESSLKKFDISLNFNIEEYEKKKCNSYYIDNDKDVLKIYNDSESKYFTINNGNFSNYSSYCPLDEESWKNADEKYKMLSIAALLFIFLNKQLKSLHKDNTNDLYFFPIPKLAKLLYDSNNYKPFLKLLLYDNLNLSQQVLCLFIYYIVDLQNYGIGCDFCLIDILFILMIKYKSGRLLRAIEKISSFFYKKNKSNIFDLLKLTNDEKEFFNIYINIPKDNPYKIKKPIILLIRYFPIQIIYYLMTHKFEEFINLIYTKDDIHTCEIVWNRNMLEDLLNSVRNLIIKNMDKLLLDKKYRYNYSLVNQNYKSCYIYYLKDNVEKVLEKVNNDNYKIIINLLCLNKFLIDYDYIRLLHNIVERFKDILPEEIKSNIKIKISNLMNPSNISNIFENLNKNIDKLKDENEIKLLKHYIIILSLIDEDENDILKYNNCINLTIYNILSYNKNLNFDEENKNSKILNLLLNYFLEQPKNKKLLELMKNEKETDETYNESFIENKEYIINNENNIIKNQAEYDNISKIVQQISRYIFSLFNINKNLLKSFLEYFTFLCEKDKYIINYINMTILPLQLLRLCTKYQQNINEEENQIFYTIFRALKTMVKNSQSLSEIMDKLLNNKRLKKLLITNAETFLKELTQGHKTHESIWTNNDLEHLIKYLDDRIDDFLVKQINFNDIYNEIQERETESYNNEIKINNIYIRVFNYNPKQKKYFKEKEAENFLKQLIIEFNENNNAYQIKHLLWSITNTIKFLQVDIKILLNSFDMTINKFYLNVWQITHLTQEEQEAIINQEKEEEEEFSKNKGNSPIIEKGAIICLQFMELLSSNEITIIYFKETDIIYCFILLIEQTNCIEAILSISNILNNLFNYFVKKKKTDNNIKAIDNESMNLSDIRENEKEDKNDKKIKCIFLFLLKKLIFYTQNKKNPGEQEIKKYIEIFNIINMYSNCKVFDLSLREMFKYYIPGKMVDNLFHSIPPEQSKNEKMIQRIFSDWLKDKIEFPDIKWNSNSFNRSYKLLCDDCQLILRDKSYIDNFENIYIETDRITENKIFFEFPDEYKIDSIYLRLFNKEPNYNIGHNLPNFLLHIIDDMIDDFEQFCIFNYEVSSNKEQELINKLKKFKEKCLITSLTSIMLIIEQINFNNNNPNLLLATNKELNNTYSKEGFSKELLNLVKICFDYPQLLNEDNCKSIIKMQNVIYQIKESKIFFSSKLRLMYLQIIYLISLNKNMIEFLSENFDDNIILDFYFKKNNSIINEINLENNNQDENLFKSDYEYILICCIIEQLISEDISHIPIILTKYLDNFIEKAKERPKVKKYIQLLFNSIEKEAQYGQSLTLSLKKYDTFIMEGKDKVKEAKIWRMECSGKKDVKYDKKNSHYCNYELFLNRNKNEEMKNYEFPIIFDESINYFKYDEFNDKLFDSEMKNIIDFQTQKKNDTFIYMKELLSQCQNI